MGTTERQAPGETSHRIATGRLSARVDEQGAQLMSLTLDGIEYLWQGDPHWWPRRAPVLFPVVGSLRPGTKSAAGPCPMARHGVARTQIHRLVEHDERHLLFELQDNAATRASYPYRFRLRVGYAIVGETTLEQRFEVTNTGEVPLPYVVGGHPAFALPLGAGMRVLPGGSEPEASPFAGCELRFARSWTASSPTMDAAELLDFSRPIPVLAGTDRLPLNRELFATDTIVLHDVPERTTTLCDVRMGRSVRIDFPGFDYLGIWSAQHGSAPFVAVEPWCGCATATDEGTRLEEKRGMRLLVPGATAVHAFTMTLG